MSRSSEFQLPVSPEELIIIIWFICLINLSEPPKDTKLSGEKCPPLVVYKPGWKDKTFCSTRTLYLFPVLFIHFPHFFFKILLNLLRRHWFQVYNSATHHLYIVLCSPPKVRFSYKLFLLLSRNHSYSKILYVICLLLVNIQVDYLSSMMDYPLGRLCTCLRPQENHQKYSYPVWLHWPFLCWISPTP